MQKPLEQILKELQEKKISMKEALSHIRACEDSNLGFAVLDHGRRERSGVPEVVFASGKTPAQTLEIVQTMVQRQGFALVTRCGAEHVEHLVKLTPKWPVSVGKRSGVVMVGEAPKGAKPGAKKKRSPVVAVVTAGTSDEPVAEEAMMTCLAMGQATVRINDVGVAGLHRLITRLPELRQADVIICIAGMEGALPSVLGGLVKCPVIAVPTSVGYGASFSGLSALLGMLNSCSPGVTVVNIDNGFGAAVAACRMLYAGR